MHMKLDHTLAADLAAFAQSMAAQKTIDCRRARGATPSCERRGLTMRAEGLHFSAFHFLFTCHFS